MMERDAGRWLAELRERMVAIARRRVPEAAVEDVVQDTLRIVVEKGWHGPGAEVDGRPGVAWCLQVLRNVIGNHYQRARVRAARDGGASALEQLRDPAGSPLESLAERDAVRTVHAALGDLSASDPACAGWLRALADGGAPGQLARGAGVAEAAFYRRLWRCREKLRAALARRGWSA